MVQNYSQLVERISVASGLTKEEIERKVEAKRARLSGLVSKEGAAQIVAAELGVNFEKQKVKINEIIVGRRANFVGKITSLFPVREYNKNGRQGKIASFVVADETGSTRVVLWDTNHIKLVESGEIKQGDTIELSNANARENEIHLTGFSDIKISSEVLGEVKSGRQFQERKLSDSKVGESIRARAFVAHAFEPRFFQVCPECNSKLAETPDGYACAKHGKVEPSKRALISVILDDGSENLRAVIFSDQMEKIGFVPENDFLIERDKILGKEAFFSGTIKENKLFNNSELVVFNVEDVEIESLIHELEKTA